MEREQDISQFVFLKKKIVWGKRKLVPGPLQKQIGAMLSNHFIQLQEPRACWFAVSRLSSPYPNALGNSTIIGSSPEDLLVVARIKVFRRQPNVVMIKPLLRAFGENSCEICCQKSNASKALSSQLGFLPRNGICLDRSIASIKISFRYLLYIINTRHIYGLVSTAGKIKKK